MKPPDYELCLKQSGYYYVPAPATTTATSTTTWTSSTRTLTSTTTHTRTTHTTTTSTVTTTSVTTTIPKVIAASIFHLEGPTIEHKLPYWVITYENYMNGYPFAAALLA